MALTTPGRRVRVSSMVRLHMTHVMPPTFMVVFSSITSYPASRTAFSRSGSLTVSGSYSTTAVSLPRFTLASETPGTSVRAFSTLFTHMAHVMPAIFMSALALSILLSYILLDCPSVRPSIV